jgi:hypothetical protein
VQERKRKTDSAVGYPNLRPRQRVGIPARAAFLFFLIFFLAGQPPRKCELKGAQVGMCVCIYVCIHVYKEYVQGVERGLQQVCLYMCVYIYICIHIHTCTYIYTYVYICIHIHIYVHTCIRYDFFLIYIPSGEGVERVLQQRRLVEWNAAYSASAC